MVRKKDVNKALRQFVHSRLISNNHCERVSLPQGGTRIGIT